MIATIGDLVEDVVVWLSAPMRAGTDTPAQIRRRRGGSAANVAVMVARCGGRARFVGCVGSDAAGDTLIAELAQEGVDLAVRRHSSAPTGTIVVIVDSDGERSFLTQRGASTELGGVDPDALAGVTELHVPGYSLTGGPLAATTIDLAAAARRQAIPVSVDASSTGALADLGVARFLHLLEAMSPTALLANEAEARLLGLGEGRPAPGVATTIVRRGSEPTLVVDADGTTAAVPVPPVEGVVDSTGAGDGFAAGWLVARQRGLDAVGAAAEGHAVAARVLRSPGADLQPAEADARPLRGDPR